MKPPYKYQPYQLYHAKPWLGCGEPGYGRRIRTRSDWHDDLRPSQYFKRGERPDGRWAFWLRTKDSNAYAKRLGHRAFRRLVKDAIRRELAGEDISHCIRYCRNWWY